MFSHLTFDLNFKVKLKANYIYRQMAKETLSNNISNRDILAIYWRRVQEHNNLLIDTVFTLKLVAIMGNF
jgi:muconolactone delta-isomerase